MLSRFENTTGEYKPTPDDQAKHFIEIKHWNINLPPEAQAKHFTETKKGEYNPTPIAQTKHFTEKKQRRITLPQWLKLNILLKLLGDEK